MASRTISVSVLCLAIAVRVVLFASDSDRFLSDFPTLTTPINSFNRVKEGLFLASVGKSPYAGDAFHQVPLILLLFTPLVSIGQDHWLLRASTFILLDLLVAFLLYHLTMEHLKRQKRNDEIPMSPLMTPARLPATVMAVYLLNPFTIFSCGALSTNSIVHACIASSLYFATKGKGKGTRVFSLFSLSLAVYVAVYPIVLLLPVVLLLQKARHPSASFLKNGCFDVVLVCAGLFKLHRMSSQLMGSWEYLSKSYLWVLEYPDLTPNVGVFWYFFAELFDRFIQFFLLIFHVHPYLYVVPVGINYHKEPHKCVFILFGIFTVFQAYPTLSDLGFMLALLTMHPITLAYMTHTYFALILLATACVLMPVMWYLWLYPASGNANFFYNQTLGYQFAVALLIIKFVNASLWRTKELRLREQALKKESLRIRNSVMERND